MYSICIIMTWNLQHSSAASLLSNKNYVTLTYFNVVNLITNVFFGVQIFSFFLSAQNEANFGPPMGLASPGHEYERLDPLPFRSGQSESLSGSGLAQLRWYIYIYQLYVWMLLDIIYSISLCIFNNICVYIRVYIYVYIYVWVVYYIWRFPEIGLPLNHPFYRIFHY